MTEVPVHEGHLELRNGHRVWYRRLGEGSATPLLLLHGGPGAGHDYLEPLSALSGTRPVIFYDQLGCGRSDCPDDRDLWKIDRFVEEIDEVRQQLELPKVHLLGQSWGGWLAIEYMLSHPSGVERLILASTSSSISQFAEETRRLRKELPSSVQEILDRHEALGDFDHPDYEHAVEAFYERFVCRLEEWPDCVMRTAQLDAVRSPGEPLVVALSARASAPPGLADALRALADCQVIELEPGAAAFGALAREDQIRSPEGGIRLAIAVKAGHGA